MGSFCESKMPIDVELAALLNTPITRLNQLRMR